MRSRFFLASLGAALAGALLLGPAGLTPAQAETTVSVVVQERPGAGPSVAGLSAGSVAASSGAVKGVAPGVRLISVKIAGADGSTDLVHLIAALDFVATTRDVFGTRVLNLSLAIDPASGYHNDPVDVAVERVWNSGVVVVTAAGNRGTAAGTIDAPGDEPFVITAGSSGDQPTTVIGDATVAS